MTDQALPVAVRQAIFSLSASSPCEPGCDKCEREDAELRASTIALILAYGEQRYREGVEAARDDDARRLDWLDQFDPGDVQLFPESGDKWGFFVNGMTYSSDDIRQAIDAARGTTS